MQVCDAFSHCWVLACLNKLLKTNDRLCGVSFNLLALKGVSYFRQLAVGVYYYSYKGQEVYITTGAFVSP